MSAATILIVEDEAITAMAIKKSLLNFGYSVCGIASGADQAVQKARELNPDLILMDIRLAGKKTGIEAATEILAHQTIPVIYLTAFSDDHFLKQAQKTEPYGYLLKPVHDQELKATIEMALYKHSMEVGRQRRREENTTLMNEMVLPQLTRNDILNEVSTIMQSLGLSRELCVDGQQAEYLDQIQAASLKIQERIRLERRSQGQFR